MMTIILGTIMFLLGFITSTGILCLIEIILFYLLVRFIFKSIVRLIKYLGGYY